MTLAVSYSETNVAITVAQYLANQLMSGGYFIYWHGVDALQTPSGWYYQYMANSPSLIADPVFQAYLATATGIMTLTDHVPAEPRFTTRHISDGTVPSSDAVMIPAMAVEVGPAKATGQYELGSHLKWRERRLVLELYARTKFERASLTDSLSVWFDPDVDMTVLDHESGTLAEVGGVRVGSVLVAEDENLDGPEATTYAAMLSAFLEYVA